MASVTLTNVSKIYSGTQKAVSNVNLTINDREMMVLVGPSGCGKSTCLRMIAGLEEISQGTIKIGDRIVNNIPPKDRDIAMVFQNYALYPHMTVYENMAFALKIRKTDKKEIDHRVREAAETLGITEYLDRKPKALSGGQRQRVAVGRAIVRKPAVFLFDEPLSNLDAKMRVQMRAEINELHHRLQTTMIYVTHDQTEAMTMGDRIAVLKDGILQQVDTPLNIYENPANIFVAGFIGTPPTNFIPGSIETIDGKSYFIITPTLHIPLPYTYPTTHTATLGIRPEHIGTPSTSSPTTLTATVRLIEPMGSETYLHLSLPTIPTPTTLIAKVSPHFSAQIGTQITLPLDLTHSHIF